MMTLREDGNRSTLNLKRRISLCAGLGLLGLLLLTGVALADTLVTDPEGISGFELYGNGLLWWDAPGVCSGEFPHSATVRVRGVTTASTRNVAKSCEILQDEYSNVVRDGSYVYFFSEGQLHRKAVNAAESAPATPMSTPPHTPSLPAPELGAYLVLAEGQLYWPRYYEASGITAIMRIPADGSGTAEHITGSRGHVRKMMWTGHGGGALVWLTDDGKLYRRKIDQAGAAGLLATRVADFAIVTRSYWQSLPPAPPRPPVTTIYAAQGSAYYTPSPGDPPGALLMIDIDTGVSETIYTASGMNQLSSVTTDRDYVVPPGAFLSYKNVYIAEQSVTCGDFFCTVQDTFIKRHKLPGAADAEWDLIVAGGARGGNLRSDDETLYYFDASNLETIATDAPALELDFEADALEIVQTTQRLSNDVQLVAGKPTYVRGYAHVDTNTTGKTNWLPDTSLRGFLNGNELPDSPLSPVNFVPLSVVEDMAFLRPSLLRSYLFQLPSSWVQAGSLSLQMTVDPMGALPETGGQANNTVSLGQPVQLIEKSSPCLQFVRMRTASTIATDPPGFTEIINRAQSLMPVRDFRIFQSSTIIAKPVVKVEIVCGPAPPPIFWACVPVIIVVSRPFDFQDDEDWAMTWLVTHDLLSADPPGCDDTVTHWVGMVNPNVSGFNGKGTSMITQDALVRMEPGPTANAYNSPRGGRTLAHELGHNYERKHIDQTTSTLGCGGSAPEDSESNYPYDPCTIGPLGDPTDIYGFDPISENIILPNMAGDLMSYATSRWVSDYTWDALLSKIPNASSVSHSSPVSVASADATGPVLLVSGVITPTENIAHFERFYQLPAGAAPAAKVATSFSASARAGMADEAYVIRLLDDSGTTLVEAPLATLVDDDGADSSVHFVQYVPFDANTRRIQLVENGSVLTERIASPNAPSLTLNRPVLDEAAQTLDLSWSSQDADDDLLIFVVQYSADDGATWRTIVGQYTWLDVRISTRLLPGSTTARLRVLATDGTNTTIATSDPFNLAKHAPEPQIEGLYEGERLAFGQHIYLLGLALDAEEGSLADSSLSWTVSGPSPVTGRGGLLPLSNLSPGAYTAALSATDADELVGTATRQFEVSALTVPDAATPQLDGTCSDAGYADAAFVRIPLGGGQFARAWLLHAGDDLYCCINDLEFGSPTQMQVGLRVDADASGDALAQPGDIGFFVDQDGIPFQAFGNGTDMPPSLSPQPGYDSAIEHGENGWSAELRIADNLVGGWDHAASIMLSHGPLQSATSTRLTADAADGNWPPESVDVQPITWASAYFGETPPQPTNRAPVADAGDSLTVNSAISETLSLDGSGSFDPDGDLLSFTWTQVSGPAVTLHDANTATPYFIATPVATSTLFRFQLVVRDGSLDSAPAETEVTLLPTLLPGAKSHWLMLPLIQKET